MHISVPKDAQCEFINVSPTQNPLISKCQIKVCYVSDEPNRNGSVITKDVARKMASSLRGAPIVGAYCEETEDFDEHNKRIDFSGGEIKITDTTVPYGFVDLNAQIWFQTFIDDNADEREYLCTEGFIWTGQFPEAERIITHGNNQSMELDPETVKGNWSYDDNRKAQFFIIDEAIISKLCILGEDREPCFEGSQIKASFSLSEDFKNTLFSMVNEVKELFIGGNESMKKNEFELMEEVSAEEAAPVVEDEFKAKEEDEQSSEESKEEETTGDGEEDKKKKPETENACGGGDKKTKHSVEDENTPAVEEVVESVAEESAQYSLEEIPEYVELQQEFATLQAECENLKAELEPLKEFKLAAERKEKEDMINSFFMLSDEDKADVVANINSYSLDDIEAKLSVICVRNKVNFSLDEEKQEIEEPLSYSINNDSFDSAPDWVKAVRETAKNL